MTWHGQIEACTNAETRLQWKYLKLYEKNYKTHYKQEALTARLLAMSPMRRGRVDDAG